MVGPLAVRFSIPWAMQVIESEPFRLFLVVFFLISVIRWMLKRISFYHLIRIAILLFLIACMPQMLAFFHYGLMHFFSHSVR